MELVELFEWKQYRGLEMNDFWEQKGIKDEADGFCWQNGEIIEEKEESLRRMIIIKDIDCFAGIFTANICL
ncbi:uncharacterized protein MONOS_15441 [Monocercomonoides exilis]|uniref:uncharacterized protein n=1 Tax=Monocercomonoides exilis TaxID=2049356 RepID=UPI00355A9AA9|nr:hypothetical protein MONOS_15441 [Monocercomonoides exilis]|eukprot:MONOS_15441.1-p1 / transcript=MONOS_15441.1 / gene=MONOS_15441 / organism=Monocercomonoides_exilis_PA203 / gene_product=unspecified product / transcript_product=unspecified product / location=Mono_scaffold01233:1325-1588(+) / protein_length=71 / sequence_SO=supercontig / SO=protein_coding / is_pseudo=false